MQTASAKCPKAEPNNIFKSEMPQWSLIYSMEERLGRQVSGHVPLPKLEEQRWGPQHPHKKEGLRLWVLNSSTSGREQRQVDPGSLVASWSGGLQIQWRDLISEHKVEKWLRIWSHEVTFHPSHLLAQVSTLRHACASHTNHTYVHKLNLFLKVKNDCGNLSHQLDEGQKKITQCYHHQTLKSF